MFHLFAWHLFGERDFEMFSILTAHPFSFVCALWILYTHQMIRHCVTL